jgi:ACT domain-containing protein
VRFGGRIALIWLVSEVGMNKELLFITVIGEDKKGIVAKVSGLMYESDINIEDISQGVMEGYFVMTMLVDVKDSNRSPEALNAALQQLGDEMGLKIQSQHENIFKAMHRI